jgi:hypothetical protein
MIDPATEKLFPLHELPDRIAEAHPRADGRKVSLASLYRWLQRGISGVKLESLLVGGLRHTSLAAYHRFIVNVTAAKDGRPAEATTPRNEEKRRAGVSAKLDALGV